MSLLKTILRKVRAFISKTPSVTATKSKLSSSDASTLATSIQTTGMPKSHSLGWDMDKTIHLDFRPQGSLVVFSEPERHLATGIATGRQDYYWCDNQHPQGVGPFRTLNEALGNYQSYVASIMQSTKYKKQVQAPEPQEPCPILSQNVIKVDFAGKKRVK